MFTIKRLNHLVLYVRDVQRALAFYRDVLDFKVKSASERGAFMRASGSDNDHDLAVFAVGEGAAPLPAGPRVGMYHAAWEVETIQDLARAREALLKSGALVGESDHGVSLSLYAQDPDGNELEVMWAVPREEWDTRRGSGTRALDLAGELARRGASAAAR
ncbi:MAG TPA: VOC family protein [Chloroflexota bacterium]|nr:VOC family protein [Chloroflexota bacterium]